MQLPYQTERYKLASQLEVLSAVLQEIFYDLASVTIQDNQSCSYNIDYHYN